MKKSPKNHKTLRLSDQDAEFLQKFGNGLTEQLEQALARLRLLEEKHSQLSARAIESGIKEEQERARKLDFLREKERIKTEAAKEREKVRSLRPRATRVKVDWGEGYAGDSDSKYDDNWGDNF